MKVTKARIDTPEPKSNLDIVKFHLIEVGPEQRPKSKVSKQRANESDVEHFARNKIDKAKNKEDAETVLDVLYRSTGIPDSIGKTFSEEEIGRAFIECMFYYDPPATWKGKRINRRI